MNVEQGWQDDLRPLMLCGLTWEQARAALDSVDCAIRRAHWCSPVVVLIGGKLMLDDDGEMSRFAFMRGDRSSSDWSMVARRDDEGGEIEPTYRIAPPEPGK